MIDPAPLRGTSLHDGVATRLRNMVFERALAPGDYIDELALAEGWQISRTPLREALKVLAAEGLVELVPRRGCRVVELTDEDAEQLFPVMAMLEGRCAHEATLRAHDDDLAALQQLHDQLERHAAAQDLEARTDVAHHVAGTHGQAPHHADMTHDAVAGDVVGGCDEHIWRMANGE